MKFYGILKYWLSIIIMSKTNLRILCLIDRGLLTLFGKTLVAFYLAVVFFTCIHVTITYFCNKDLWFKYFPVDDDSNLPSPSDNSYMDRQDL